MKETEPAFCLDVLFDLSPDLLCLIDHEGCFLKVNKYLRQTLGYNEEELVGRNLLDFVHPEDQENTISQLKSSWKSEKVYLFKNRYRCASGLYKSLSWNATVLPDETLYASARDVTHYIKVQSQLAKAITDNEKIYNNSVDMLCTFNAAGEFTKVSKAAKAILGYEEQELLGKRYLQFLHPDDVTSTLEIGRRVKLGNHITDFENRYIHKEGLIVPMVWSAQWLPLENTMFATGRDATEREKQKEILHFNERRLGALLESGNDIIGILSPDCTYKYVSPSVKKIFHLEPESFIGKSPIEFIHPEDIERLKETFDYILSTEETVHISPFRIHHADNQWYWVETFATNLINDPAIDGIVYNLRDISIKIKDEEEKQLAAEKLKLSNERFELVTEATKDAIWDWNLETNQLDCSSGFKEYFGDWETFKTLKIETWQEHLHADDKERVLNSLQCVVNNPNESFWKEEYRYLKADGSIAYVIDQGYVIRNADKKAIRMVGSMHDNTELKEKELYILKQNQQLREIAQINSHVIRRPVATILGLVGIIDKSKIDPENLEIMEHLETATEELDQVIRQINDRTLY